MRKILAAMVVSAMCNVAKAEIALSVINPNSVESAYGALSASKGVRYLADIRLKNDKPKLFLSDFFDQSHTRNYELNLTYTPLVIAPRFTTESGQYALVGLKAGESWQIGKLDIERKKADAPVAIKGMSLINEVLATKSNFNLAGISSNGLPALSLVDSTLKKQSLVEFSNSKEGEVSSLLSIENGFITVINYVDATADLVRLNLAGQVQSRQKLNGGAASGIRTKNGAILVSYRKEKQFFVELLTRDLVTIWTSPPIHAKGVTARKGAVVELTTGFGLVDATDGKMRITRLSPNGAIEKGVADEVPELGLPASRTYLAFAINDVIHVRGQARAKRNLEDASTVTFHAISR